MEGIYRLVGILRVGIEQGSTFRTKSRRVSCVLLIGSRHNGSVVQQCGGAY